jgi:hypothetical protein
MNDFNNKYIFFTFREYENKYNTLLKQYLDQHEDFNELMFLDIELEFYDLCFNNSNIILVDYGSGPDYSLDGTLCYHILPKIYDTITTFSELNNGFDLELGIKYTATFSKIIKFLEFKKDKANREIDGIYIDPINNNQQHNLLKNLKSPQIKKLITEILNNSISLFNVVNYINEETTEITYDLFIKEFNDFYNIYSCEFMFSVNIEDIKLAIEREYNEFEFIYVNEEELLKINPFIREINGLRTVYNVHGFSFEKKNYTEKIIYLNNLMIDYHNGFSNNYIENFENISFFRSVYNYLNKINVVKEPVIYIPEQIKQDKDIIEADGNNYIKSTIEDFLCELVGDIDTPNYDRLVNALYSYFSNSVFPTLSHKIIFKRVNKKKVGWALKEVYKNIKPDNLDIEYLRFAQQNINLFEKEIIVEEGFNKSKFYKVFTTNPAK